MALNVDFDVLLTVLGGGIYRMFARSLRGYERAQARQIFRRFLDTTARIRWPKAASQSGCRGELTTPSCSMPG